jgi:hypothetical protein
MFTIPYMLQFVTKPKLIILAVFLTACGKNNMLTEIKILDHYPSASGIEYFNNHFYIIGDDANDLLILDSNLTVKDSIQLYSFAEKRIPKPLKADLESITLTAGNKLLILGSGSKDPYRNTAWLIDPVTKQKDSIQLDTFYSRLKTNGIQELNIEGACAIPGYQVLSNRGSKGKPENQLIFTGDHFWETQATTPIATAIIGANTDSSQFSGVSGMTYALKTDRLILTVSTEDTRNNVDDGAIGKSYLWIIKNISGKIKLKAIHPDQVIDLEKMDKRFNRQKIESVCIIKETPDFLYLLLAADNDNGSSTLFKVVIEKD